MKLKVLNFFQTLSKAFLMPIALLSVASLLLGVSSIFLWHEQLKEMFPIINAPAIQYIAKLLTTVSDSIMGNLGFLFAISLAFSLNDEDREYAAFGAVVGYIAFNLGMGTLISNFEGVAKLFPETAIKSVLGITTIETGVLGGIIVGLISGYIHKWAKNVRFPIAFSFFGGLRFVPIANALFFVAFGQVFPFLWIPLSSGINAAAQGVANTGIFAPFFYGFGERLLIPTGLHHIWNTVIRDTAVSGTFDFGVSVIEGARPAYNEFLRVGTAPDLGLPTLVKFLRGNHIPVYFFVLPAMALAMYKTALPENKSKVKPLLLAGVFTSLFAGVSEPIEFAFLFASPMLYLIYAVMNGLSFFITYILGNTVGGTEPSVIGIFLYGFLQPTATTWIPLVVGAFMGAITYPFTKWWILRFNIMTPGRTSDKFSTNDLEAILGDDYVPNEDPLNAKIKVIVKALGGKENIIKVDNCFTRLRVNINDISLVDESLLSLTDSMGFVKADDNNVQVIYGPTVGIIKDKVVKRLKTT